MSGRGKAPKAPEARLGHGGPLRRGEWVTLPATSGLDVPAMPEPAPDGGWSEGTARAWASWWSDPAALCWSPGDREQVIVLAYLRDRLDRSWAATLAGEVRRRERDAGLTCAGKQDRRWRVDSEQVSHVGDTSQKAGRYDHLRIVEGS